MKHKIIPFLITIITLCITNAYSQAGLIAEYFDGKDFNRKVATRIDPQINFEWNHTPLFKGMDPAECSMRWQGFIVAPESGDFLFSAKVDDGIRVWIGDRLIIDAWGLNDEGKFQSKVRMEKGAKYSLKVEYFNALFEGEVSLLWVLPSEQSSWSIFKPTAKPIGSQHFIHSLQAETPKKPEQKPINKPTTKPAEVKPKPKETKPVKAKPAPPPVVATKPIVIHKDTLEKYVPSNVHFRQSKSIILEDSKADLDKLADFLLRNPAIRVHIEGHTDIIGDPALNLKLSEERALTVARYLTTKGIESSRIKSKGFGSTKPIVNENTDIGHAQNRRVVFILE